jgi:flagellar basal-body rod protein FlgC
MELTSMDVSAAGMRVQRLRMDQIAQNVANVDTTSTGHVLARTPEGESYLRHVPYRRKTVAIALGPGGAPVGRVAQDPSDFRAEHQPGHPHAVPASPGLEDAGTVYYPNVNPMTEMVDMIAASRAYEANVTALEVEKAMAQSGLRILG